MRSSFVKTLVVTVSMFAVVSAAAVTAEARPARPSRTTVSAPRGSAGVVSRAIATLKALQKRFFGIVGDGHMGPPLPEPSEPESTSLLEPAPSDQ